MYKYGVRPEGYKNTTHWCTIQRLLLLLLLRLLLLRTLCFGPLSGRGLPSHLSPSFVTSRFRLPLPCLKQHYGTFPSTTRLSNRPSFSEILSHYSFENSNTFAIFHVAIAL